MAKYSKDKGQEELLKDILFDSLIDAAFVYQIQKGNLDEEYLHSWTKKQKTAKLLNELGSIDLEAYY